MIYGYARVSTPGQDRFGNGLEAQREKLRDAGAVEVREDVFTGTKSDRPALTKLLADLTRGDTLLVTKLDRLGRSVGQVNDIIEDLIDRGVIVNVLNLGIMDNTSTGRLMRNMLLAIAEFERDMIVERTADGKAVARQNPGYREGRRPKFSRAQLDHAMALLRDHSYAQVEKMTGISKATLGRERRRRKEQAI